MPDYSARSSQTELMDDLSLAGEALAQNLEELEVINRRLGGNGVVLDALDKLLRDRSKQESVSIVDFGTGGGDLPRAIAKWARKRDRSLQVIGIDANPFMIEFSRRKAAPYPEIAFEEADIFSPQFQSRRFDISLCSLFCHHFSDEDLVKMFQQMGQQSKLGFIVNDLHRHPLAYRGIQFLTWLFRGSHLVRHDGPVSVLRAFKKQELEALLEAAGIQTYSLRWKWAFRWQLIVPTQN